MKVHCLSLDPVSLETAERKHKDKEEFHLSVPLRGENQHNPPQRLQTWPQTAQAQAALAQERERGERPISGFVKPNEIQF